MFPFTAAGAAALLKQPFQAGKAADQNRLRPPLFQPASRDVETVVTPPSNYHSPDLRVS